MSTRPRGPSANDPDAELLREIRRTKMCRGYDASGTLIWEQRIYNPSPVWMHLVHAEPRSLFDIDRSMTNDTTVNPHAEVTFYRIGVEVDNAGTWVRYALTPRVLVEL